MCEVPPSTGRTGQPFAPPEAWRTMGADRRGLPRCSFEIQSCLGMLLTTSAEHKARMFSCTVIVNWACEGVRVDEALLRSYIEEKYRALVDLETLAQTSNVELSMIEQRRFFDL